NPSGVRFLNTTGDVSISGATITGNTVSGLTVDTAANVNVSDLTLTGNAAGGSVSNVGTFTYTTTPPPAGRVDDAAVSATQLQHPRGGSAQQASGRAAVTAVVVNTLDGNDTVSVNGTGFNLTVNLGDGDDTATIAATAAANTTIINGDNND